MSRCDPWGSEWREDLSDKLLYDELSLLCAEDKECVEEPGEEARLECDEEEEDWASVLEDEDLCEDEDDDVACFSRDASDGDDLVDDVEADALVYVGSPNKEL